MENMRENQVLARSVLAQLLSRKKTSSNLRPMKGSFFTWKGRKSPTYWVGLSDSLAKFLEQTILV